MWSAGIIGPWVQGGFRLLACAGILLMGFNVVRYIQLVRAADRESYFRPRINKRVTGIIKFFLIIFFLGHLVNAYDLFSRRVEPVYLVVSVIFFLGAVYVALVIRVDDGLLRRFRAKNKELTLSYTNSVEMKSRELIVHSRQVHDLVELFWQYLPREYQDCLDQKKLLDAALLHDIGMLSVTDQILNKTGILTADEWLRIKEHTDNGRKMLGGTILEEIGDWVLYHHERVDGLGYHQLPESRIPLESLIISIADTYSALSLDRAFRTRRSFNQIMYIMRGAAGSQLDLFLSAIFFTIPRGRLEALTA